MASLGTVSATGEISSNLDTLFKDVSSELSQIETDLTKWGHQLVEQAINTSSGTRA